jgi:hypothetical protein
MTIILILSILLAFIIGASFSFVLISVRIKINLACKNRDNGMGEKASMWEAEKEFNKLISKPKI